MMPLRHAFFLQGATIAASGGFAAIGMSVIQSVPMEDHEVRDTLRRATTPELYVELVLAMGSAGYIVFPLGSEISNPITIFVTMRCAVWWLDD